MTEGLDTVLATAARQMDDADSSADVLDVAVGWSLSLVPGCEMAGVTLRRRRGVPESMAPSGPAVAECDKLQEILGEGPCLDAITDDPMIVSPNVAHDSRWPRWGPRVAAEHGVASMLSVRLFSSERTHGALNLYSRQLNGFDSDAKDIARLLGTHVSVALRSALADEQLRSAVDSRNRIGQAQGILMERYALDAERAFALLSRLSQDRNIKLIDIAEHVIQRRELPGVPEAMPAPG